MKIHIYRLSTVLLAVVLLSVSMSSPTMAALPDPSSPLVGSFVQQTDGKFGYQMLRPGEWDPIHLGDARGYFPKGTIGKEGQIKADRVLLSVVNLQTLSSSFAESVQIATLLQFEEHPTLSGWTSVLEQSWQKMSIPFKKLNVLPNAAVYALTPIPGQIHLVGYVVDNGTPLVVSLYGFGTFGSLESLTEAGLVADFETMVASAHAFKGGPGAIDPPLTEPELGSPPPPSTTVRLHTDGISILAPVDRDDGGIWQGDYHCHGSTCGYDYWTNQKIRWDGAIHQVQRMYEAMWYRHSDIRSQWLFRAEVTDSQDWCTGAPGYISHPINKQTSSSSYQVSDDYWPYYSNTSIGDQTYHGVAFGDLAIVYCHSWQPFY